MTPGGEALIRYGEISDFVWGARGKPKHGIAGGGDQYQCTTYVNYRVAQNLECALGEYGAADISVGGHGYAKVDNL